MVTDQQVRRLRKLIQTEKTMVAAAAKAGMDEKTARKYRYLGKLPSEVKVEHTWRTQADPFDEIWEEVKAKLGINPGLEAKTLFEDLQRRYPGRFADGQIRTLQRRIKTWRAVEGPAKEVFFAQEHRPGELCQSDFTHMSDLGVTLQRQPFKHLIYHFVLPYSNWETGMICFSESFESLSEGLQNAIWDLGVVPKAHKTERLSTAGYGIADLPDNIDNKFASGEAFSDCDHIHVYDFNDSGEPWYPCGANRPTFYALNDAVSSWELPIERSGQGCYVLSGTLQFKTGGSVTTVNETGEEGCYCYGFFAPLYDQRGECALTVTELVEYHVTNILGKLDVASRIEATAWVREHLPDDL